MDAHLVRAARPCPRVRERVLVDARKDCVGTFQLDRIVDLLGSIVLVGAGTAPDHEQRQYQQYDRFQSLHRVLRTGVYTMRLSKRHCMQVYP